MDLIIKGVLVVLALYLAYITGYDKGLIDGYTEHAEEIAEVGKSEN